MLMHAQCKPARTIVALVLLALAATRGHAGDGDRGVEVKGDCKAVLVFHNNRSLPVTLHNLSARQVEFTRARGRRETWMKAYLDPIKEVHMTHDVLVRDAKTGIFVSDLERFRYSPGKETFQRHDNDKKPLPVWEPCVIVMTNGTSYPARLSSAIPGKLELAFRKDSIEPPASAETRYILTVGGVYVFVDESVEKCGFRFADYSALVLEIQAAIEREEDEERRHERERQLNALRSRNEGLKSLKEVVEAEAKLKKPGSDPDRR